MLREGIAHCESVADYVSRETRRALAGAGERCRIYPGIDIDIPTGADQKKTSPDEAWAAV